MSIHSSFILHRLVSNPKNLFGIDCLGALLTAVFLSVVLAQFETFFGMPPKMLHALSGVAFLFALYSGYCYLFVNNRRPYLKVIAFANLGYCAATIFLLFYHHQSLTIWGLAYFAGELAILCTLAFAELKAAFRH